MSARLLAASATMLAAVLTAASPAQAQCPGNDGTLPGSGSSVTTISTPVATAYVDDRDFLDLDDDGDAGSIWIYLESNGQQGLQRGGDQVAFDVLADHGIHRVPSVGPIRICTPVVAKCVTLFPSSGPYGSFAEAVGMHDDCFESSRPDTILF